MVREVYVNVVFFNVIGAGHVNPTLPIVAALSKRGDRVTYFTSPKRRAAVEAAGATFRNYGYDDFTVAHYHPKSFFPFQLLPATVAILPYLLDVLRPLEPELVVTDAMAPWGLAVAKALNIPVVGSVSTFAFDATAVMAEVGGSQPDDENLRAIAALERDFDVHFDPAELGMHYARDNVVYTTQAYNPPFDPAGRHFEFVGPMIQRPAVAHDFPLEALDHFSGRRLYISMGTIMGEMMGLGRDFFAPFFEAFGDRDDHLVVLSTGEGVDIDALSAPKNFIVRKSVPQLDLLPRVDAFVTHAGMNSMSEGLFHGVPLIAIPGFGDQNANAARIQQSGAGITLKPKALTAEALLNAVETVLGEPSFREAARRVSEEFRAAGGVAQAVAFLDRVRGP